MNDKVKGFCVKYCLTVGIFAVEGEIAQVEYVSGVDTLGGRFFLKLGRDFFYTRAEAEERAKDMAFAKEKSLEKAITKIGAYVTSPKWRVDR